MICGILLVLLAAPALAQFTLVSGTITDPNGLAYSNGTISPTLVISGSPKFTATNQPYTPPTGPVGLSSTGSFQVQLADVTTLTPGGGTWSFTVNCGAGCVPPAGGKGSISFTITGITISGGSQNISAQLQAAAPVLSTGGGGGTFPTAGNATFSAGNVTITTLSGFFAPSYVVGQTISVASCSAGGDNSPPTFTIASVTGSPGSVTAITYADASGAAASGCVVSLITTSATPPFSNIGGGTNPNALLMSGSLAPTGGGTISANILSGLVSAPFVATNGSGTPAAAPCTATQILVGNSTNFAVCQPLTGDSSITNTGVMKNIGLNGTILSTLATGPLCNTTSTGVPFICLAGNIPILNQSTTGNAATATALAAVPSNCGAGNAAIGILANGNATGCFTPSTGTITGVTAGTGLTGGGSSGSVTLNLTLPVSLASAATALASTPSTCGPNIAATGITANGTPVGCFTPSGTLNGMVAGEPAIGESTTSAVASPAYVDAFALNVANGSTWDMCKSITQAFLALGNLGTVDARGFTGNQGCTVATATGSATNGMFPNANCQLPSQGGGTCSGATIATGKLLLGAVNWYLPVVSTEAGNTAGGAGSKVNYERLGTVIVPQGITIEGSQNTSAAGLGANTSNVIACQSAGYSGVTNCPAPATTEIYQISSITVTQQTAAPGRQYAAITTATTNDLVGGVPFRISGAYASGNPNIVDFNASYTACESSAYADVVTDAACGGGSGPFFSTGVSPLFTIYAPVNSGITSLTVTAVGSGYGGTPPTCSLPAPTNAGGVQATCVATVSGGSVSGLYVVNRGTGYASGVTAGAVTLSGNATATYQTIPSSCTRGTNVDCGYLYGELPLFHAFTPKAGTSAGTSSNAGAGVSMGIQFRNINVDCKFVPSCVGIAGRSIQEQSQIKDSWAGDSPDRDIDIHGFASQNADTIDGLRVTVASLSNRQKTISNGAYTFNSGNLVLTTGTNSFIPNGILYVFGSPAHIGCAASVQNTTLPTYPTYIPLPIISNTGTVVTLDDSGTNCPTSGSGTDSYQIGEACEPGKEAVYLGDVGPHGMKDITLDISGCANTGNFPVAVNAALRMNVNSTSSDYFQGGHAEGATWGVLFGADSPTRGVNFLSWAGIATPGIGGFGNTIQAGGPYQDEQSASAIKIRSEYFTTASGPATTDYIIQNIQRNNANGNYYTINDDSPVNATGTDGGHIQDSVTTLYAVDQVPSCPNGISNENMLTTASIGSVMGCNMAIGTAKGGNALIFQGLTGGTAVGFTANTVAIYGNFYNQNLITGPTHFNWNVAVADSSTDNYDLGLYGPCAPGNAGCPLLVHLGATAGTAFAPSTGLKGGTVNICYITPGGCATTAIIPPGNYYIAGTCNTGCTATLVTGPTQMELVAANSATASSGGALPATIAIPAAAITSASVPQMGIH